MLRPTETVREAIAAYHGGDLRRFTELLHPDMTLVTLERWLDGGTFRGREAALGFFLRFSEAWEPSGYEYDDFEEFGDRVLLHNRLRLHSKSAGLVGELEQWAVFTVGAGVVVEIHYFETREDALDKARRGVPSA